MKKNKLYKINKGNKLALGGKKNIFYVGGPTENNYVGSLYAPDATYFFGLPQDNSSLSTQDLLKKQAIKEKFNSGLKSLATTGIGVAGSILGNSISGGLSSNAGTGVKSAGKTIGGTLSMVNPLLGAGVIAGSEILGGIIDSNYGYKLNDENIADIKAHIKNTDLTSRGLAQSKTSDQLFDNWSDVDLGYNFSQDYIGTDGKRSHKVADLTSTLKGQQNIVKALATRRLAEGVKNVNATQKDLTMGNFTFANGGSLFNLDNDMGAIGYSFMSDYLTQKKKEADIKNKMAGITPMPAFMNSFDLGGVVQTHGGDFSNGLTHINEGGSHEENPQDGVQVGVDNEGTPNLVEEGETIFNDYVYSDRILADEATKQMFHISKKRDISFAELSKKLEKEAAERPNDPISQKGLQADMETLAEQQERQKHEMEVEKATKVFESLSPDEKVAIMQNAQQQEAAQQTAMQEEAAAQQQPTEQPMASQEEIAMEQQAAQQETIPADNVNACGGKLYPDGGYLWETFAKRMAGYKPSLVKGNTDSAYRPDEGFDYGQFADIDALEASEGYKAFTDYVVKHKDDPEVQAYLKALDAGTYKGVKKLFDGENLRSDWETLYRNRRTDKKAGIYHLNPLETEIEKIQTRAKVQAKQEAPAQATEPQLPEQGMLLFDPKIMGDVDKMQNGVRTTTVDDNGTKVTRVTAPDSDSDNNSKAKHRYEGLRYAGLFGPAVGLGMQMAGVGKPDYSGLDSAVQSAGDVYTATYRPLGNYLSYRPMDIWYEQNRLNANSRATDRALMNSSAPSRMAGLIANGYNSQIASGELYRKALEYNDAKRQKVAEFNRGTDQFNAEAFNKLSQFNADARNKAAQHRSALAFQSALQKMDADSDWYNSLYGNVAGLFKGISDLGRENAQWNTVSDMWADGLAGTVTKNTNSSRGHIESKGGKIKKKKGFTF